MRRKLTKWIAGIMAAMMITSLVPMNFVYAQENTESVEMQDEIQEETQDEEVLKDQPEEVPGQSDLADEQNEDLTNIDEPEPVNDESTKSETDDNTETIKSALNYLYINESEQAEGSEQQLIVSWGDGTEGIQKMELLLENESKQQTTLQTEEQEDGIYLFQHTFEKGVYHVLTVKVFSEQSEQEFVMEDMGISAYFGVGKEYEGNDKSNNVEMDSLLVEEDAEVSSEDVDISVVTIDEKGTATAQENIADAIEQQSEEVVQENPQMARMTSRAVSNVVVVLDPGHDNTHAGAGANGLREEQLTLKIAQYCKQELEQYSGVTVYMTRNSGACPHPGTSSGDDNAARVDYAASVGADVYVSIHLNSAGSSANGAEVYYPNTNYNSTIGAEGKNLAAKVQSELTSIGLHDRGIKIRNSESGDQYPDGSLADYYGVIRRSKLNGFPGIIIEHAYLTNSGDVSKYLNNESGLKKLGVADATGIVKYFGLSKGYWETGANGEKYYYAGGERVVGEKNISGKWYYFDPDKDGAMVTGFYDLPGKKVYYGTDGAMRYGEQKIDNKWYYFDTYNGAMATGFYTLPGKTVYYNEKGQMLYGNQTIGGVSYYFNTITGAMQTGWVTSGGKKYYYSSTGVAKGEQKINNKWYYFDTKTGALQTGFVDLGEKTVYYGSDGAMRYGEQKIDGKWYYFDTYNGAMVTGFYTLPGKTVYYNEKGQMLYGEQKIEGKNYAFNTVTGAMITNGTFNEKYYGSDGIQSGTYLIEGKSATSIAQMVRYFNKYRGNRVYPTEALAKGGAPDIETLATIFYEEASREGIKAEVLWTQTMKETGFLQYGGQVQIEQFNFAGLGATDGGVQGASFPDVRTGVRAQVQHMKAYACASITKDTLATACVDPRFDLITPKGCAIYVEWLGQKENPDGKGWATAKGYGTSIVAMIQNLLNS